MVFKKAKMIERVTREGKANLIDDDVLKEMDNLDGQEVNPICWERMVHGEPVYWCIGKNGIGNYVNENDCE